MHDQDENDSLPPFIKSWRQLYLWVVFSLILTIVLLYFFNQYFS